MLGSALFVFLACGLGIFWAIYNWQKVKSVQTTDKMNQALLEENRAVQMQLIESIGQKIQDGARVFLMKEYCWCSLFLAVMAAVIFVSVDKATVFWTTFAFLVGGFTSVVSGYIAMLIAVSSNFRTTIQTQKSLAEGFTTAYQAGCAMGFSLVSIALCVLNILILIYFNMMCQGEACENENNDGFNLMMEGIAGYGLGGSTVALFGRVGGGIYTKAADVGADLVGKVENELSEDSPRNPATIADNVGDNVGDVAGMGSDLFGSFAESTCAALIVSGNYFTGIIEVGADHPVISSLYYPLNASAAGIIICIVISVLGLNANVDQNHKIEATLKNQLLWSSIGITIGAFVIAQGSLPAEYFLGGTTNGIKATPNEAFYCTITGLWAGFIIGWFTEYMTSHTYGPVREVANSCETGAATNIIYGLALGYYSTIVPAIAIGVTAFVSFKMLGFFGIALAALGMLGNLPIGLAIDGYGPISDNAGGIAEMALLGEDIRDRTDALDAAGNTTAAIGKGFAIGSAALVSLALFGGFITRALNWTTIHGIEYREHGLDASVSILDPAIFSFLMIGAMLPYVFAAMTMKSVGEAALEMVQEIRQQIKKNPGILTGDAEPDYASCIAISTEASIKKMIPPGILVIGSPFLVGILFGPTPIVGLLLGLLVSGVQLAISSANTGGAWDNAKKYIEAGQLVIKGVVKAKKSDEHKAAVIGDTVGDPLKDTSGPSLNILVKLSAILSLVFADVFCETGLLVESLNIYTKQSA